jgi:hypothetical protein
MSTRIRLARPATKSDQFQRKVKCFPHAIALTNCYSELLKLFGFFIIRSSWPSINPSNVFQSQADSLGQLRGTRI